MSRQRFSPKKARQHRKARNLSPEQEAVAVGRSYSTVVLWELGKVTPPLKMVERLAALYGVPIGDLFEDVDEVSEVAP